MIVAKEPNYRALETDSSNLLIESDSRQAMGRYEEAAFAARQAGELRMRMGQLRFEVGDYESAAEAWLSAAACFVRGGADVQAEAPVDFVKRLRDKKLFPDDRKDLVMELAQRESEIGQLRATTKEFLRQFGSSYQLDTADRNTLDFLLKWRSRLPGYALLHYAIYRQAQLAGERQLACEQLTYASKLDNKNENYAALLGYLLASLGKPWMAKELGEKFLNADRQETGAVRIMVASVLGSKAEGWATDREEAIEVLRPVTSETSYSINNRLAAMALSAGFSLELGLSNDAEKFVEMLMTFGADHAATMDLLPLVKQLPTNDDSSITIPHSKSPRTLLLEKAKQISLPLAA